MAQTTENIRHYESLALSLQDALIASKKELDQTTVKLNIAVDELDNYREQNAELRRLQGLLERFLKLKYDNPKWHFWIAPDENGKRWAAGFTNGERRDKWIGNNTDSCPSAQQALQWVLDNFEVQQ